MAILKWKVFDTTAKKRTMLFFFGEMYSGEGNNRVLGFKKVQPLGVANSFYGGFLVRPRMRNDAIKVSEALRTVFNYTQTISPVVWASRWLALSVRLN